MKRGKKKKKNCQPWFPKDVPITEINRYAKSVLLDQVSFTARTERRGEINRLFMRAAIQRFYAELFTQISVTIRRECHCTTIRYCFSVLVLISRVIIFSLYRFPIRRTPACIKARCSREWRRFYTRRGYPRVTIPLSGIIKKKKEEEEESWEKKGRLDRKERPPLLLRSRTVYSRRGKIKKKRKKGKWRRRRRNVLRVTCLSCARVYLNSPRYCVSLHEASKTLHGSFTLATLACAAPSASKPFRTSPVSARSRVTLRIDGDRWVRVSGINSFPPVLYFFFSFSLSEKSRRSLAH